MTVIIDPPRTHEAAGQLCDGNKRVALNGWINRLATREEQRP